MKKKRILALFLAAVSCLSLAVSASAAGTTTRKATDFKDYDAKAWYAEAVSSAVDNGLLYGKSSTIIDPNGDMIRAEMAAIMTNPAVQRQDIEIFLSSLGPGKTARYIEEEMTWRLEY